MTGDYDHYHGRLRKAIDKGAKYYTEREPGWFFIAAFPFNNNFLYRTTWFVNRYGQCLPLAVDPFVRKIKNWREKDTNTRIARTRAFVAADALHRIRRAMVNGDIDEYNAVIKELTQDEIYGPIMEIVTGHYGVEYANMIPLIELLLQQPGSLPQTALLGRALKDIKKSVKLRKRGVFRIADTLSKLVMLRAGAMIPRPQALAEARNRLASLPPA
ncbi:MAG: hypothetical protein JRG69_01520 [Deltaproteobacteria bacterium]|nr:hypothetical protein [Deltaproteobacteria bacterium]